MHARYDKLGRECAPWLQCRDVVVSDWDPKRSCPTPPFKPFLLLAPITPLAPRLWLICHLSIYNPAFCLSPWAGERAIPRPNRRFFAATDLWSLSSCRTHLLLSLAEEWTQLWMCI